MKSSIVAEPFSVKMNMLKAAGEVGTNWMTIVVILWQGIRYLRTVSKSWLLKVYKGKEDPLTYDSCHEVAEASYENVGKSH